MITGGAPEVETRILWVAPDRRTACVVWRMTPGALRLSPAPQGQELLYVLEGEAMVCSDDSEPLILRPGTWLEMPRTGYELRVNRPLHKTSVLYKLEGLTLKAEPR